jgi:hypothetical protein
MTCPVSSSSPPLTWTGAAPAGFGSAVFDPAVFDLAVLGSSVLATTATFRVRHWHLVSVVLAGRSPFVSGSH